MRKTYRVRIDGSETITEVEILSVEKEHRRVTHPGGGVSRTKQADAERANINSIMSKYARTGTVPANLRQASYGDFSNVGDYLTARLRIQEAEESFAALPADVRKHVNNDPAELLDLLDDESRREEAIALGVLQGPEESPPIPPAQPTEADPEAPAPEPKATVDPT